MFETWTLAAKTYVKITDPQDECHANESHMPFLKLEHMQGISEKNLVSSSINFALS